MSHVPVLLKEVIETLQVEQKSTFVDGTAGFGGHSIAILNANPKSTLIALDIDCEAASDLESRLVQLSLSKRAKVFCASYSDLDKYVLQPVDGILLDLGLSSTQLDSAERGFSFQKPGPLDMRYDKNQDLTAEKIVNRYPETKLFEIFKNYGEEKFSKRIAHEIVEQRKTSPISDTTEVFHLIQEALPKPVRYKAADNARRIFQALRIEVNSELSKLKEFLTKALEHIKPQGRLAIISFHSLEDRIVKHTFKSFADQGLGRIITKKPVIAQETEVTQNPRSKPAKLRIFEKI